MNLTGARLLLVLPQLPQDPSSGAARSTRTICEMLAAAGTEVRAVATTATERAQRLDTGSFLRQSGIAPTVLKGHTANRVRPEIEFSHRGIAYRLLDTGPRDMHGWQKTQGAQFDRIFDDALHSFRPDALIGYGGLPGDLRRWERARRQGARMVFALRNMGYESGGDLLRSVDGILTASRFLSNAYRDALGIESTPLPLPIDLTDVVAAERDPIFFTMINPSPEKGVMLFARLAEELSVRRPDIPLLVIESRGSAGNLVHAGLAGGFDLRRHENLMTSPAVPNPADIYAPTRALLAPSFWPEPAGRVAVEALLNGVPPLVSERGGLPEMCNGAGFTFALPENATPVLRTPVAKEVVEPWIDLMIRLEDDQEFYAQESRKALEAAQIYRPENLAPRYVEYFRNLLDK